MPYVGKLLRYKLKSSNKKILWKFELWDNFYFSYSGFQISSTSFTILH